MRVVLDANVFVSAAIKTGPSHRLVQRWLKVGEFEVVVCPQLIAEVTDVLMNRPRIRRWIDLDAASRFVELLGAVADVVPDPVAVEAMTRDRDDDYLVALARRYAADFIVSGDRDLLEWVGQVPPVITPAAFEAALLENARR